MNTAFVFGASGEIGSAIVDKFKAENYEVTRFSREAKPGLFYSLEMLSESTSGLQQADSVVWASGVNLNDSINNYSEANLRDLLEANLFYITNGLAKLLETKLLKINCNLVIISSVWQGFSKQNKFSYTVSKSAIAGLVHSLTADLSPQGMRVNAILPGVVDTQMTRAVLTPEQILTIQKQTPTQSLVSLESVANLAYYLSTASSQGINGQSIVIDGGWSLVRYV
jgi:3-oxoacyl-[acyl-carrier protein] reductase